MKFPKVVLQLPGWVKSLESRGISIIRDVLREQAKAVLLEYGERGGLIYNPGRE